MACSHVADCPLFPKLNATLQIWRDSYCDSTAEWKNCERFKLAATGRRVPLGLLPNGHLAQALQVAPERPAAPAQPGQVAAPAGERPSWWARLRNRVWPSRADRYSLGRHSVGVKATDTSGGGHEKGKAVK